MQWKKETPLVINNFASIFAKQQRFFADQIQSVKAEELIVKDQKKEEQNAEKKIVIQQQSLSKGRIALLVIILAAGVLVALYYLYDYFVLTPPRKAIAKLEALLPDNTELKTLNQLLLINPEALDTLLKRAQLLQKHGFINEALIDYEKINGYYPEEPSCLMARGQILLQLGRPTESLQCYDLYLKVYPGTYHALIGKGKVLVELGKYKESQQAFDQAIQINPSSLQAYIGKGKAALKTEDFNDAINHFERATLIDPKHPEPLYLKAFTLYKIGEYDEAKKYFEKVLLMDPKHAKSYMEIGNVWIKKGKPKKAVKLYNKALELSPHLKDAIIAKASALTSLKRFDEALEMLNNYIMAKPDIAFPHYQKSLIFVQQNKIAEAIEAGAQAIILDPYDPTTFMHLANLYNHQHDLYNAERCYRQILNLVNKGSVFISASEKLGWTLLKQNKIDEAQKIFDNIPTVETKYNNSLGKAAVLNYSNPQEALTLLMKYTNTHPKQATAWNVMGLTYVELKDKKKALQMFKKALDNDAKMEEALTNMSAVSYELGQTQDAIKYADQAIKLNPNNALAYKLKGLFLAKQNQAEATACIAKANDLSKTHPIIANKYVQDVLKQL